MGVVPAFLADVLGFLVGTLQDPAVWIIAMLVTVFAPHRAWVAIAGATYSLGLLGLDLATGLGRPAHVVIGQFLVFCGLCICLWPLRRVIRRLNNGNAPLSEITHRKGFWRGAARAWLAISALWLVFSAVSLAFVWVDQDRSPFVAWELNGREPCHLRPLTAEDMAHFEPVEPGFVAPEAGIERARRCMDWDRYHTIQTRFWIGLALHVLGPPLALAVVLLLLSWVVAGFKRNEA